MRYSFADLPRLDDADPPAAPPRLTLVPPMRDYALTVVQPTDTAALQHIASHVAKRSFWTDDMLASPLATFAYIYANPANFVVLGGPPPGDGVLAYVRDPKPWRASFFGVCWGRSALRRPDLGRIATAAAFRAMGITALDGVTSAKNTLACRALTAMGFERRAVLPGALRYDGVTTDAIWYEITAPVATDPSYLL